MSGMIRLSKPSCAEKSPPSGVLTFGVTVCFPEASVATFHGFAAPVAI
jgi:hypothetical protein